MTRQPDDPMTKFIVMDDPMTKFIVMDDPMIKSIVVGAETRAGG
jgi:hypothetical protein